ncbi:hypothetical protein CEP51_000295 [Fusarium floridanum]|uniref:Uncharacterized protein n=1 Tax=Fusarium floridanum TaxID=1325733 RepID=A0A428SNK6_9HYPO|nr:hypothetical protein CEP51_000295 [Fusarium floridanum]
MCLPPEVRANIAQNLLSEYATARNMQLSHLSDSTTLVKVSTPIEMSYVTFEGVTYVDNLTNKTEVANDWVRPKVLYIASDHRGIRKLIFCSSDESPKVNSGPDLWWQTLPLPGQNGTLRCHHDGLKLIALSHLDESGRDTQPYRRVFSTPQSPTIEHRHVVFCVSKSLSIWRLSLFQYNRPEITGISVCCNPAPLRFHAHTSNDDLSFYDSTPYDSTWVYTPLNENERIMCIWMRARTKNQQWIRSLARATTTALSVLSNEDFVRRQYAIVFQTNQGRMLLFGGQWIGTKWMAVDQAACKYDISEACCASIYLEQLAEFCDDKSKKILDQSRQLVYGLVRGSEALRNDLSYHAPAW